jgi:predicted nicotinamide N-methyase
MEALPAGPPPPDPARLRAFILRATVRAAPPLVPEIALRLATEIAPIWTMTEAALEAEGLPPPFWAFAWAGGQALARFLLDAPETVAGRRVLAIGCGGGVEAIAAARAGAAAVIANDVDPVALVAATLNAEENGVAVEPLGDDLLAAGPDALAALGCAVVLAGDAAYERPAAARLRALLRAAAAGGAAALVGDAGRGFLDTAGMDPLAAFDAPVPRALEDRDVRRATVWRVRPD